jgi:hypothetical protein
MEKIEEYHRKLLEDLKKEENQSKRREIREQIDISNVVMQGLRGTPIYTSQFTSIYPGGYIADSGTYINRTNKS